MNPRSVHIESFEHQGGVYSVFYNDISGNWFVKLEDGNRPNRPVSVPYRIPGNFNNGEQCRQAVEEWSNA